MINIVLFDQFQLVFIPGKKSNLKRVSNYKHYFGELNIEGSDFCKGFKCSDVHKLENLNNLSIMIFAICFYQDQNKWRHKLIPLEISINKSDRFVDL